MQTAANTTTTRAGALASKLVPARDGREDAVQRLADYLNAAEQEGTLSAQTARTAWLAWSGLEKALWVHAGALLPVPDACPGADGQLLYTWRRGEHYLELEVFADRPGELFYRNGKTGALWEAELTVAAAEGATAVTPEITTRLALFA